MKSSIRTLLSHAIDYAGLFPPAELDMNSSTRNYHAYRIGPHGWMLGRFVVPVSRLEEFNFSVLELVDNTGEKLTWKLSALTGSNLGADVERIHRFNRWHAGRGANGSAVIDVVEVKASSAAFIETAGRIIPRSLKTHFEMPVDVTPVALVKAIARLNAGAKVRTGGATPDVIPRSLDLARFLVACQLRALPFKATAGLRHPICSVRPLGNEPGGPVTRTYGFLNLFLAAAFVDDGMSEVEVVEVLDEESADAFVFDDCGVRWHGRFVSAEVLEQVRHRFAISFGSCSFDDPIQGLKGLGFM
ncbi:MAG: hypothetical protein JSW58_16850 [Candidatus Latescibacterota bacterium]|nr:MAG: hypothetical protein JSW58_16850 [Candidatus Latescibacterota bacterium]